MPDRATEARLYVDSDSFTDPAERITAIVSISYDQGASWQPYLVLDGRGGTDRFGQPNRPSTFQSIDERMQEVGIVKCDASVIGTVNFGLKIDLTR